MVKLIKRIAFYLIGFLAAAYAYQYLTGRSIINLPRDISDKLNEAPPDHSRNVDYYNNPTKRIPKE
jgi:hypothetical protein